jgi:tRNA(fMet)-specific endonuclease VapC
MIVLDTDTLSLLFANHARVVARYRAETDDVVTTIISRIETLQGRFATLLKAADGAQLLIGQERLDRAESDLATFQQLPINAAVSSEFDRLRQNKKLKKIGRGDLLIAAITLANQATLVTRNEKDFRKVPGLRIENWAD